MMSTEKAEIMAKLKDDPEQGHDFIGYYDRSENKIRAEAGKAAIAEFMPYVYRHCLPDQKELLEFFIQRPSTVGGQSAYTKLCANPPKRWNDIVSAYSSFIPNEQSKRKKKKKKALYGTAKSKKASETRILMQELNKIPEETLVKRYKKYCAPVDPLSVYDLS